MNRGINPEKQDTQAHAIQSVGPTIQNPRVQETQPRHKVVYNANPTRHTVTVCWLPTSNPFSPSSHLSASNFIQFINAPTFCNLTRVDKIKHRLFIRASSKTYLKEHLRRTTYRSPFFSALNFIHNIIYKILYTFTMTTVPTAMLWPWDNPKNKNHGQRMIKDEDRSALTSLRTVIKVFQCLSKVIFN